MASCRSWCMARALVQIERTEKIRLETPLRPEMRGLISPAGHLEADRELTADDQRNLENAAT